MRRRGTAIVLVLAGTCGALAAAGPATAADRWESKADAPLPRQEAAFAELDGKLHLIGGLEQGGADSARHDVYDTATGTWATGTPLPEPGHHIQAATLGGKLYVVGGVQSLGFVPTGRMWEFDPASGLWTLKTGLSRGAGAVVAHDGKLFYLGGLNADGDAVANADVYDPATNAWTPLFDMPTARDHLGAAVIGGRLYVVGGRQAAFGTEIAATEALDLTSLRWRGGLAPLPDPRAGSAASVAGDEIVVIGGESPDGVHEDVDAYHPGTDTWRTLAAVPLPRHGIQGVPFGGGLWIAGGGIDLLVGATAATDVLYPGPRPVSPLLSPPVPPPPAGPGGGSAVVRPVPRLSLQVRAARRGARRVSVRVNRACTLELRSPRGKLLARGRASRAGAVALRVRRGLARGRYVVVARAGSVVVRRAARVR